MFFGFSSLNFLSVLAALMLSIGKNGNHSARMYGGKALPFLLSVVS